MSVDRARSLTGRAIRKCGVILFGRTGQKQSEAALLQVRVGGAVRHSLPKRTLNDEAEVRGRITYDELLARRPSDDITVKYPFLACQQVSIHLYFLVGEKIQFPIVRQLRPHKDCAGAVRQSKTIYIEAGDSSLDGAYRWQCQILDRCRTSASTGHQDQHG